MSLTPGFKKFVGLLVVAGVVGGAVYGYKAGYFNHKASVASSVPSVDMNIPTASGESSGVSKISLAPAQSNGQVKIMTLAWNATAGLHYANGGVTTKSGSLMAQHGANVILERQDDYSVMISQMAAFAKDLKAGNANPSNGAPFTIIMGDALPAFSQNLNKALAPYGQNAVAVAQIGFSRGEDKCMLPPAVKANPQLARGLAVGGVERDGDLHICFKWAKDNNVPINADSKTYDPDALNIISVDDFTKADEKYIAGYCEDRPGVKNGQRTGETHKTCSAGTATWTPGDVTVATKKGGIVAVASTKEYSYQMPALLIGDKQWMDANPDLTKNIIAAALEGSEAVANSDQALLQAGGVEAAVYKQEDAAYWAKYFKGFSQVDAAGITVQLGGSATSGLADNAFYFGLNGNDNIFKKVYTVYGNIDHAYYPTDLPTVLPYDQVVDTSYLQALLSNAKTLAPAQTPNYSPTAQVKDVVSKAVWKIEFQTGKASFTPATQATLEDLLNQISAGGMAIQIKGYTDNVGDETTNLTLSAKRAQAVKAWITANAPTSFPADRIKATGYGSANPVADNATAQGRAQNRRVEILQVTTQ